MLRARSTFAVIFAIILILGAVFVKHDQAEATDKIEEAALERSTVQNNLLTKEGFLENLKEDPSTSRNLTQTDLIARQLFGDYMSLSSKGQATPENLDKLASSYANSILAINSSIKLTAKELNIVQDSQMSLQIYASRVESIRKKYKSLLNSEINKIGGANQVPGNLDKFGIVASTLYKQSANELLKVPTPTSVSDTHLNIINSYLESSNNLKEVSKVNTDPGSAFAALNLQVSTSQKEEEYFGNLKTFLNGKGIDFDVAS